MAFTLLSISTTPSSLSSFSFSSISRKPYALSLPRSTLPKVGVSLCSSTAAAVPSVVAAAAPAPSLQSSPAPPPRSVMWSPEPALEGMTLEKYVKSRMPGGIAAQKLIGTGRRKRAIARVVLQEGTGVVVINYRPAKEYLQGNPLWMMYVKTPLRVLGFEANYDVFVKAHGGGLSGQAQAISLGISRALLKVSESHRVPLRKEGLLTRDSRIVEKKKVGLKKARKAPQYSKR